jgi:hypothetical protein
VPLESLLSPPPASPTNALLERTLGPDWRCLPDVTIRVGADSGTVDLAALHPRHGVVLVAFLGEGEEASPDEAAAALRAMLGEQGFADRFPGQCNVTAVALAPNRRARLAEAIRAAAGEPPEAPPAEGWVAWLSERLVATPLQDQPPAPEPPLELRLDGPREPLFSSAELAPQKKKARRAPELALVVAALIALAAALSYVGGQGVAAYWNATVRPSLSFLASRG